VYPKKKSFVDDRPGGAEKKKVGGRWGTKDPGGRTGDNGKNKIS